MKYIPLSVTFLFVELSISMAMTSCKMSVGKKSSLTEANRTGVSPVLKINNVVDHWLPGYQPEGVLHGDHSFMHSTFPQQNCPLDCIMLFMQCGLFTSILCLGSKTTSANEKRANI